MTNNYVYIHVLFGGTPCIVTMLMIRKQKDEDISSHDYDSRSTGGYVLITTFDIYLICRQES